MELIIIFAIIISTSLIIFLVNKWFRATGDLLAGFKDIDIKYHETITKLNNEYVDLNMRELGYKIEDIRHKLDVLDGKLNTISKEVGNKIEEKEIAEKIEKIVFKK